MQKSTSANVRRKHNNRRLIEVLGPIEDLESYVKADWWREIFNANYLRTDGDVVNDDKVTRTEVGIFLDLLQVERDARILDLCCGQGRHVLEMARQGYRNVHGLDRSHYLVTRARGIARKEGLPVTLKEGDARKLPFAADRFDVVTILGNSFGYFETQQDDIQVLEEVRRVLKPGGKLLVDITDGDYMRASFEPRSWEWIDKNYFVCRERSLSADNDRLVSREVITHVKKGVIADQFYAERLYSTAAIEALLGQNGFTDIEFKQSFEPQSGRNQDLGMMARRNIVVGRAHKLEARLAGQARSGPARVAVLLGDPGQRDRIKPGERFDDDDHYTIEQLKLALAELPQFEFSYFDRHVDFVAQLGEWRQRFDLVFNLCDEGFNNIAAHELHVPALLEIGGMAYTGGNPQCLAYCYDKSLIRGLASEMDVPVADAYIVNPENTTFIDITIPFPVIIKPNYGDSSFGITRSSVCNNVTELERAILESRQRFGYDCPVLVEQYLTGKDISVGIIGNPSAAIEFLPVIEEDYSMLPPGLPHICGYEAKWDPESPYWQVRSVPAGLDDATEQFLRASCLKLFERLDCRDYARFDWRLDDNGTPRLLEVNPNPGWCWDGHLAKMAKLADLSYAGMLARILEAAIQRQQVVAATAPEIMAVGA
ncbi:MAG: methyltransferase domain-containing protein [Gammaproteobacteria bacterium]|nr:methyltransferase domain-containing protein [Gammaproteobacteria bacterium]